jgi:hypothetical protein
MIWLHGLIDYNFDLKSLGRHWNRQRVNIVAAGRETFRNRSIFVIELCQPSDVVCART